MECPYCSAEMQVGYIQCRDGVYWSPQKRMVAAIAPHGTDIIALGQRNVNPFSGSVVIAYRCSGCQKIIMDSPK